VDDADADADADADDERDTQRMISTMRKIRRERKTVMPAPSIDICQTGMRIRTTVLYCYGYLTGDTLRCARSMAKIIIIARERARPSDGDPPVPALFVRSIRGQRAPHALIARDVELPISNLQSPISRYLIFGIRTELSKYS
jgi:hypothetical protein